MPNLYAYAPFHVEHVDKEYAAGVEPEAVFQGPEGQHLEEEYEGADQDQELGTDFTDCFSQQGKHRCMIKPSSVYNWVLQYYYTIAFKFIGVDWYLVAWVGLVYPDSLITQIN